MATIEVKLGDVGLKNVRSVHLEVGMPLGDHGEPTSRASALRLVVVRDANREAQIEPFDAAANEDGSITPAQAVVTIRDANRQEAYTLEVEKGYVSGWSLDHFDDGESDGRVEERLTLLAGKVRFSGAGSAQSFELEDFVRKLDNQ